MNTQNLSDAQRGDLRQFASAIKSKRGNAFSAEELISRLLPEVQADSTTAQSLNELLEENGFDGDQHDQIRSEVLSGRIGLAINRLSASTTITDVSPIELYDTTSGGSPSFSDIGKQALESGQVAP